MPKACKTALSVLSKYDFVEPPESDEFLSLAHNGSGNCHNHVIHVKSGNDLVGMVYIMAGTGQLISLKP